MISFKINKSKNKKTIIKVSDLEIKDDKNKEEAKINAFIEMPPNAPSQEKYITVSTIDFSPVKNFRKTQEGNDFKFAAQNIIGITNQKVDEVFKVSSPLLEMVIVSDTNMAFNLFPYGSIKELVNTDTTNEERQKMLDLMLSHIKSISNIDEKFKTAASFAKFMIEVIDIVDDESIPKIINILKYILDTK